ncbi:MAG: hypothetical protein U0821_15230 [Chloroflexota bacterium]
MKSLILNLGQPNDALSFPRVLAAGLLVAVVLGLAGWVFDLVIGPLIGMSGWWTVTGAGGFIYGITLQSVREYAAPIRRPATEPQDAASETR